MYFVHASGLYIRVFLPPASIHVKKGIKKQKKKKKGRGKRKIKNEQHVSSKVKPLKKNLGLLPPSRHTPLHRPVDPLRVLVAHFPCVTFVSIFLLLSHVVGFLVVDVLGPCVRFSMRV